MLSIFEFIKRYCYLNVQPTGEKLELILNDQVKEFLGNVYPEPGFSKYNVIATGGDLGQGSSTACMLGFMYDIYCMNEIEDAHKKFQLLRSTKLNAVFFGKSFDGVAPGMFTQIKNRFPELYNEISIILTKQPQHIVGRAVFTSLMTDFKSIAPAQVYDYYKNVVPRLKSRFDNNAGSIWIDRIDQSCLAPEIKDMRDDLDVYFYYFDSKVKA